MGNSKEIYPLKRDNQETSRLNEQHKLMTDIVGGLVHDSIPLTSISTVADVATGTGIWLYDVKQLLQAQGSDTSVTYHGFDISNAQFPTGWDNISFSVQDALQPFPEEHRNRYDLIYIRLLVAAFKESQIKEAVDNLVTLLKPGGYLQWVDIDFSGLRIQEGIPTNRITELIQPWIEYVRQNGLSECAPGAISASFKEAGLSDIRYTSSAVLDRPELNEPLGKWQYAFYSTVIPLVVLKTGRVSSPELVEETAKELKRQFKECLDQGQLLDVRLGTVVGRKPGLL